MKTTMLRSLSLFIISLMMAFSVAAQDEAKVKTIGDKEAKYKSEDLKMKNKKDKEEKYKSEALKIKDKKEEGKYKTAGVKIKDEKDERKVKADVKPMQRWSVERTQTKTGKEEVRTREHFEPVATAPEPPEPVATDQVAVPETPSVNATPRKYAAHKRIYHRPVAVRRTTRPRYIVRTKTVRDTVYVPSPPEKVVTTQTQYVHDTVNLTRVDTVFKMKTENTYTGYRVPRGNFKKVKLKKDKNDGGVWMKRKDKDDKTKVEEVK